MDPQYLSGGGIMSVNISVNISNKLQHRQQMLPTCHQRQKYGERGELNTGYKEQTGLCVMDRNARFN